MHCAQYPAMWVYNIDNVVQVVIFYPFTVINGPLTSYFSDVVFNIFTFSPMGSSVISVLF